MFFVVHSTGDFIKKQQHGMGGGVLGTETKLL
jgi:hypothetical protein